MNKDNRSKINKLLSTTPTGIVLTSSWLRDQGYSHELQKRYKISQWFKSIGSGAMIRTNDYVEYEGAVYALQNQLNSTFHPAGRTALAMLGKAHYLNLGVSKVFLFASTKEKLPSWFFQHDWGVKFSVHKSDFLPPMTGLLDYKVKDFTIKISSQARAMLECLYLCPKEHSFKECYELMIGLNNLRPDAVQELLKQCSSVKVIRLFLYLAEKTGHSWFNHIKLDNVDLGKGKRSLVQHGVYIPSYRITVPKEMEENEQAEL